MALQPPPKQLSRMREQEAKREQVRRDKAAPRAQLETLKLKKMLEQVERESQAHRDLFAWSPTPRR